MSDGKKQGQCLCGAVQFSAPNANAHMSACHCKMCRKWGGGPLLSVHCGSEVSFSSPDLIGSWKSSKWAERGFCKQCGSHLFYRYQQAEQTHYIIPAGLFADDAFDFTLEVFVDHQSPSYHFVEQTQRMTEAEVFAMFSGGES